MNKILKILLIITSIIISLAYFISGYIFFNLIFYTRSIDNQQSFNKSTARFNSIIKSLSLAKNSDLDTFIKNLNKNKNLEGQDLVDEKIKLYDFLDSYNNIEELNITSFDNLNLKGYLLKNDIENNNKFIIIVHPYRGSHLDLLFESYDFYKLGFNILLLDVRAHGNSDGEYITLGYKEGKDLGDWINYIVKRYPNSEIATYGMSMGASIVLSSCGETMSDNYKLCIADCPFDSVDGVLYNIGRYLMGIPYPLLAFILSSVNIFSNIINGSSIYFSISDSLIKSKVPILFIHGDRDYLVPSYFSKHMYNNYKNEKDILIVKNAGHCECKYKDTDLYLNKIKDFCNKYLNN